ncbi:MAG: putative Ig domain-containing protein, partial [Synergistaceae bacterium]|nr:putative Ig domain-containing protein [Synergistaceae bacterium]
MKRGKIFMCSLLVTLLALLSVTSAYAAYYDEGYNGMTEDKAYRINTYADFVELRDRVKNGTEPADRYYKLTQDITILDRGWESVGKDTNYPFMGHFNGNGNTITANCDDAVFGTIDTDGVAIKYLNVKGNIVWEPGGYGSYRNASIAHTLKSGTIENCNFEGKVVLSRYRDTEAIVGGVAGVVEANGIIRNCRVSGDISSNVSRGNELYEKALAGGIAGRLEGGTIEKCRVTINDAVHAKNTELGNQAVGTAYAGGIVGYVSGETSKVNNCVVKGIVRSQQYAGGIVGYMQAGTLTNCYVLGDSAVEANYISGSIAGYLGGDAMADNNMIELDSQVSAVSEAVGGVIGHLNSGTVTSNRAYTRVKGRAQYKGAIIGKATGSPNIISDNYYYADSGASNAIGFDNSILGPNDIGGTTHTEETSDVVDPVDPDPLNPSPFKQNTPVVNITIDTDAILPSGTVGTAYSQTLAATPSTVTWAVESGSLPNGLALSTAGAISGTPTLAGSFSFTVRATSSNGANSVSKSFTLAISPSPTPALLLTVSAVPESLSLEAGASSDVSFHAENNSGVVTWTLGTVPAGIIIEPANLAYATQYNTGIIYTVTGITAGSYSIIVTAVDESGSSATATLTVTVSAPAVTAPKITTPADLGTLSVGDNVSIQLQAIGTPPYTWELSAASGSLPDGVQLDDLAGLIWGTATTAGTYTFTATASNSAGSDSREFTLVIAGTGDDIVSGDAAYEFTYNGHRYRFYTEKMTPEDAKAFCEKQGGYLATITSQGEQDAVADFAQSQGFDVAFILGGTDYGHEGTWSWMNGEEWSYTNWAEGQPDNGNVSGDQNYLHIVFVPGDWTPGVWDDSFGDYDNNEGKEGFICEWGDSSGGNEAVFNGHRYRVYSDAMTWDEAKAFCEKQGGHLATITSQEEQNVVERLIASGGKWAYWLGATDDASGLWTWITGEDFSYTHFAEGEPEGSGNCLQMYGTHPDDENLNYIVLGYWDDTPSDANDEHAGLLTLEHHGFVCEWDGDSPDENEKIHNGHRYRIYPDGMTWTQAKEYCESLGGHLVTITSQEEQNVVASLVLSGDKNSYWLGGQKNDNDAWSWIDGSAWDYTHWA